MHGSGCVCDITSKGQGPRDAAESTAPSVYPGAVPEILAPSAKRRRVYVRRFDHDEAARRHAAGETIRALAAAYGVTFNAVYRAATPGAKERDLAALRQRSTVLCEGCGRPRSPNRIRYGDGRLLCHACRVKTNTTRFRFDPDGTLIAVRCNIVACVNGERWQPPENFAGGLQGRDIRAKGFTGQCRACNTAYRRDLRARGGS